MATIKSWFGKRKGALKNNRYPEGHFLLYISVSQGLVLLGLAFTGVMLLSGAFFSAFLPDRETQMTVGATVGIGIGIVWILGALKFFALELALRWCERFEFRGIVLAFVISVLGLIGGGFFSLISIYGLVAIFLPAFQRPRLTNAPEWYRNFVGSFGLKADLNTKNLEGVQK